MLSNSGLYDLRRQYLVHFMHEWNLENEGYCGKES
jgi:hypothetical protein